MTLYNDGILADFTAGFMTTFLCYPFDIYKTFQQDYRKNAPKTFLNITEVLNIPYYKVLLVVQLFFINTNI
mgnify:CR=1 FL=1